MQIQVSALRAQIPFNPHTVVPLSFGIFLCCFLSQKPLYSSNHSVSPVCSGPYPSLYCEQHLLVFPSPSTMPVICFFIRIVFDSKLVDLKGKFMLKSYLQASGKLGLNPHCYTLGNPVSSRFLFS